MRLLRYALFAALVALQPGYSYTAQAPQSNGAPPSSSHTSKNAEAITPPSSQEIADAKAKGLVWVNTSTHVYHKEGSFYGTTKHGKFMTEEDARKAGYRAAKTGGGSKKSKTEANTKK